MVDLAITPAPLAATPGRLWRAPVAVAAAFTAFAVWYFWSWSLSAGEAAWIAALFVVPPLLVGGLIAGLIRLAVAGLGHDALRDLRTVLYGVRRARWPAFARLFDALLDALFGPRLISIRSIAVGLAIYTLAFVFGLTLWALVVPGDALTLLVEHGLATRHGVDFRSSTVQWLALLFPAGAPAFLAAALGTRIAGRLLHRWTGLAVLLLMGAALPCALLVPGLGLVHASFESEISLPWILAMGLRDVVRPTAWAFREPTTAALYPIFLPSALFLTLAFSLPVVRTLVHGLGPAAVAARRHPLRAALLIVLAVCVLANTGLVMARAGVASTALRTAEPAAPPGMALQERLVAQAATLIFDGDRATLRRLAPGDVQVTVVGDQAVYREHRDTLAANLATFGRLTGRDMTLGSQPGAVHTLTIAFVPEAQFNTWGWRHGAGLLAGLAKPALCRAFPTRGYIYIGSDLPAPALRRCIAHELAHYVGLRGHACIARPSVLCRLDTVERLTDSDSRAIAALFSPALRQGMTGAQGLEILLRHPAMTQGLGDRTPGY